MISKSDRGAVLTGGSGGEVDDGAPLRLSIHRFNASDGEKGNQGAGGKEECTYGELANHCELRSGQRHGGDEFGG